MNREPLCYSAGRVSNTNSNEPSVRGTVPPRLLPRESMGVVFGKMFAPHEGRVPPKNTTSAEDALDARGMLQECCVYFSLWCFFHLIMCLNFHLW